MRASMQKTIDLPQHDICWRQRPTDVQGKMFSMTSGSAVNSYGYVRWTLNTVRYCTGCARQGIELQLKVKPSSHILRAINTSNTE